MGTRTISQADSQKEHRSRKICRKGCKKSTTCKENFITDRINMYFNDLKKKQNRCAIVYHISLKTEQIP